MTVLSRFDFDQTTGSTITLQSATPDVGAFTFTKLGGLDITIADSVGYAAVPSGDVWCDYGLDSVSVKDCSLKLNTKPGGGNDTYRISTRRQAGGAHYRLDIWGSGATFHYNNGTSDTQIATTSITFGDPFTDYLVEFSAIDNPNTSNVDLVFKLNGVVLLTGSHATLYNTNGSVALGGRSLGGLHYNYLELNNGVDGALQFVRGNSFSLSANDSPRTITIDCQGGDLLIFRGKPDNGDTFGTPSFNGVAMTALSASQWVLPVPHQVSGLLSIPIIDAYGAAIGEWELWKNTNSTGRYGAELTASGTGSAINTGSQTLTSSQAFSAMYWHNFATSSTLTVGTSTGSDGYNGGSGWRTSGAYRTTTGALSWTVSDPSPWYTIGLTINGEAQPAVITGPSGAAGAGSITVNAAENQANVGTWTATDSVSWSLSGTDAASFSIDSGGVVTKASGTFDYETKSSYSFVVNNGTASQTVTLNVTNVNEPPLAPTIGTATAGNLQATVTFTPPVNTGRPAITSYTVTSSPGGITASGSVSPITVTGLTGGTPYTFTVTATNSEGTGPASSASNSVTPTVVDTTPPTMNGSITVSSLTSTSYQLSWLAASDNVAVTSYEVSLNSGSTYSDIGLQLSYSVFGRIPSSSDGVRVRAKDAANNLATPLSTTVNLPATGGDVTAPVLSGVITSSAITTSSFTASWPAATDNVAVTGYEYSLDNGTTWNILGNLLTKTVTGLMPAVTTQFRVRAFDAAGNRSSSLFLPITTLDTTVTTATLSNGSGTPVANTLLRYSFFPAGRIGALNSVTAIDGTVTSNSAGICTIAGLPAGLGVLMIAFYATSGTSNATTDLVYYEAITVA